MHDRATDKMGSCKMGSAPILHVKNPSYHTKSTN